VVLPDLENRGVLDIVDGLRHFIVIHENEAPACRLRKQLRRRHRESFEHVARPAIESACARRTDVCFAEHTFQVCIRDRRTDGIGVGMPVPDDVDGFLRLHTFGAHRIGLGQAANHASV
jgi:hypothetical protein